MRQNIICHIISEQELSLPPDDSRWIIHPASFLVGKCKIYQPPSNNITLNFLSHNTCMLLSRDGGAESTSRFL